MKTTSHAHRLRILASAGLLALATSSCLSLGGDPPRLRFFSVEVASADASIVPGGQELRLRRVLAAGHLRERFVWSSSEVERGFYDFRRWTEPPAAFLERLLVHELFEVQGLRRSEALQASTLDATLVALEEDLGAEPAAHARLLVHLTGPDGASLLDRTLDVRVPIARPEVEAGGEEPSSDPAALAAALAEALRGAVSQAGEACAEALPAPEEEETPGEEP